MILTSRAPHLNMELCTICATRSQSSLVSCQETEEPGRTETLPPNLEHAQQHHNTKQTTNTHKTLLGEPHRQFCKTPIIFEL